MLASMEKCDSMILKLDDILQKDPGFGGVIPRFLGSHSKLNAEKSLTLFSALFFYLFQGLKWEKRGDEW